MRWRRLQYFAAMCKIAESFNDSYKREQTLHFKFSIDMENKTFLQSPEIALSSSFL